MRFDHRPVKTIFGGSIPFLPASARAVRPRRASSEPWSAQAVVELGEQKSILVLIRERQTGAVVLIEDAKFHGEHPFESDAVDICRKLAAGSDVQLEQIVR
jgi:hypothetical protein